VTQTVGECEVNLRVNLYLINAGELIFHGVFDGDNLLLIGVNFVECGVEGGRFAGAGGASD